MAVEDYETSAYRGAPASLFEFWYGDAPATVFRYCNAVEDVVFGGETYLAVPVDHGKVQAKGRGDTVTVEVKIATSSDVAQEFTGVLSRRVMYSKILKGHLRSLDDPGEWSSGSGTFEVHWIGRVSETKRSGRETTISCADLGSNLKQPMLGFYYQRSCQHLLYGTQCGADKSLFEVTATVDSIPASSTGIRVTMDAGWEGSYDDFRFVRGSLEWDSTEGPQVRMITEASGNALTLDAAPFDLSAGDTVKLYLGCARTTSACRSQFNNIVNFGGQPSIPLANPIGKNNHT